MTLSRFGGGLTLVAALLVAVAVVGLLWGALFGAVTLLSATFVVGFVARELVGGRASIQLVLASGAVGSVVATLLVPALGLPVFIRFAGIPLLWAIVGAAVAIAIGSTLSASRSA